MAPPALSITRSMSSKYQLELNAIELSLKQEPSTMLSIVWTRGARIVSTPFIYADDDLYSWKKSRLRLVTTLQGQLDATDGSLEEKVGVFSARCNLLNITA